MIKVNSDKCLKKLTVKGFRANQKRNALLIMAIIFATFLLTTVFSIGVSYVSTTQNRTLKMRGIDYDAVLNGPSMQQVEKLQQTDNIKNVGLRIACSYLIGYNGESQEIPLRWYDKVCWKEQAAPAMEAVKGTYPAAQHDLMLSKKALRSMGISNPTVGMELMVTYYKGSEEVAEPFTLTGWYSDYTGDEVGLVSEPFYRASGADMEGLETSYLYINFKNPIISSEDVSDLEKSIHIREGQVLRADTELISLYIRMALGVLGLSALIIVCGYLLIYNIMLLSVTKEVRYYGLLKTIGITAQQIQTILNRQIRWLLLLGIPVGLLLGAAVSFGVVPATVKALSYTRTGEVSFHPIIFLGAAAFTIATVISSVNKPIKIAKEISPVEAAKYVPVKGRRVRKRGRRGGKLEVMAVANVFREKKRAVVVFLSLIIGMSSFICFGSVIKSNGADNVLNTLLSYDIQIFNKSMKAIFENENPQQIISDDILQQIRDIPGVADINITTANKAIMPYQDSLIKVFEKMYEVAMNETLEDGRKRIESEPEEFWGMLVGVDEKTYDSLTNRILDPVDKERFMNGEYALVGVYPLLEDTFKTVNGKEIVFTLPEGKDTQQQSLPIKGRIATGGINYSGIWPNIIVSEKIVRELVPNPTIDHIDVVYKKPYDKATEAKVKAVIAGNKLLKYESKMERHKDMKKTENQLKVMGGGLALILAVLGLLNYINMVTAGIQSRKQELAILQGIGMTSVQQKKMLMYEGLCYGVISVAISVALGTVLGKLLFSFLDQYQVSYLVPVGENIIFFILMLLVCVLTPYIVYRVTNKESVIEKLREIE